jgi:hypothetical protein
MNRTKRPAPVGAPRRQRRAQRLVGLVAPLVSGGLVLFGRVADAPRAAVAAALTGAGAAAVVVGAFVLASAARSAALRDRAPLADRAARPPPPQAQGVLGAALAVLLPALPATGGALSPLLPLAYALLVAAGGLVAGKRLAACVPAWTAAIALAVAGVGGTIPVVVAAILCFGFSMLGRALFFGAVKAAAVREAARVDAELLSLYEDARLFRLVGGDDHPESDAEADEAQRLVARALSVRDGAFRLLRMAARALDPDSVALYVLDPAGKELLLKEQHHDGDVENAPRVPAAAGARGRAG